MILIYQAFTSLRIKSLIKDHVTSLVYSPENFEISIYLSNFSVSELPNFLIFSRKFMNYKLSMSGCGLKESGL